MEKTNQQTHTVNIKLDEERNFTYDPSTVIVDRKDIVVWNCEKHPTFAVHVGWNSPLEKGRYRTSRREIKAQVLEDAQPGRYKYFVAVLVDDEIWTDDPEIIVRRPSE